LNKDNEGDRHMEQQHEKSGTHIHTHKAMLDDEINV
jgi:hypothetical protein